MLGLQKNRAVPIRELLSNVPAPSKPDAMSHASAAAERSTRNAAGGDVSAHQSIITDKLLQSFRWVTKFLGESPPKHSLFVIFGGIQALFHIAEIIHLQ